MYTLYHFWLSPSSRKVRLALSEKRIDFVPKIEKFWERRPDFLSLNPAGDVPILVNSDKNISLSDCDAICLYLEETYPDQSLLGKDTATRTEIRRLMSWFDKKFHHEVTQNLLGEKIMKRLAASGYPNSHAIRAGHHNIHCHLDYIGWLTDRRSWLAGDELTLADLTAAAHLSCLDYMAEVPWDDHPLAKGWYARLKSRPSFRVLLTDHVPGLTPSLHYANLDF